MSKIFYGTAMAMLLAGTLALSGCTEKTYDGMTPEQMQAELQSLRQQNQELQNKLNQAGECAANAPSVELKSVSFTDIDSVPTKGFIQDLGMLGVFGNAGTEFKPYQPITRGEFITWLFNSYNALMPDNKKLRLDPGLKPVFKDVPKDHATYPYVQALSNAGYSVGYQDGTFRPDKPITREEMIAIKLGLDGIKPEATDYGVDFTDKEQIDKRYRGYVWSDMYSFKAGPFGSTIQRAFGNIRVLKPKQPVLRHEAAAALWQFENWNSAAEKLGNKSAALPPGAKR